MQNVKKMTCQFLWGRQGCKPLQHNFLTEMTFFSNMCVEYTTTVTAYSHASGSQVLHC